MHEPLFSVLQSPRTMRSFYQGCRVSAPGSEYQAAARMFTSGNPLSQQIKHLRIRPRRRFQPLDDPPFHQTVQFRTRLIQIAEIDRAGRACSRAPRIQPLLDPVVAECAFIGVPLRIDEPGVVGASRDTSLAPGTFLVIH